MMQLGQTLLIVSRFRECVEFYRDGLGFEIVRGDAAGPLAEFQSGGNRLTLFERSKLPAGLGGTVPERPGSIVLVVVTDDVDGAHRRLSARGVSYAVEPKEFPEWGVRSSVCRDPEGNLLEIVSPPRAG